MTGGIVRRVHESEIRDTYLLAERTGRGSESRPRMGIPQDPLREKGFIENAMEI